MQLSIIAAKVHHGPRQAFSALFTQAPAAQDPDFGSMTEKQQLEFALSMSKGAPVLSMSKGAPVDGRRLEKTGRGTGQLIRDVAVATVVEKAEAPMETDATPETAAEAQQAAVLLEPSSMGSGDQSHGVVYE